MDDKSKGISLRQKKSKRIAISNPKPITDRNNAGGASRRQQSPEVLARQQSNPDTNGSGNTADLVKRRYSTRFNQIPDFGKPEGLPPVPSVPAVPAFPSTSAHARNFSQSSRSKPLPGNYVSAPRVPEKQESLNLKVLADPQLQIEAFANAALVDATDDDLRQYQASLESLKARSASEVQHNVYENRTQFIKISKEADKLKDEMRTLRGIMSELVVAVNTASVSAGIPEVKAPSIDAETRSRARKLANRSSVANLEAMWNTQLHALWKSVEGSQKYLPAVPGRHIVLEQAGWVELDAATWKAKQPAHLILLNDHLLVATTRQRRMNADVTTNNDGTNSRTRKVADRCWPLQNIDMVDLATIKGGQGIVNDRDHGRDQNSMMNAVSVRCNGESFTYRYDKNSSVEKIKLLQEIKRTAEELKKTMRTEMEEHSKRHRDSLNPAARSQGFPSLIDDASRQHPNTLDPDPNILIEVDGKHQSMRWVDSQIDELDSEIALHEFEAAVTRTEKLRLVTAGVKNNLVVQRVITEKVDKRVDKLSDMLCHRLSTDHARLSKAQKNVEHLWRLSREDLARTTYLDARKSIIDIRVRSVVFEGDLRNHIFQLSYIYFTLMRNTVKTFQQCFPPSLMSACVTWSKDRLDEFNDVLARQLSSVQHGSATWQDCMATAKQYAGMMDEVGLKFSALVKVGDSVN